MLTEISIAIIAAFVGGFFTYIFTRRGAHNPPCRYTEAVSLRVDGIEDDLKSVNIKIDNVKGEVDGNRTSIALLNTQSAVLQEQYKNIMTVLSSMSTKLDKLHILNKKDGEG